MSTSELDQRPTDECVVTDEIAHLTKMGERSVFPFSGATVDSVLVRTPGLSKRELFAAMAMQGAMQALAIQADEFEDDEPVDPHPIARDAVRMADALLKELAK